jgi:hypothetical protein
MNGIFANLLFVFENDWCSRVIRHQVSPFSSGFTTDLLPLILDHRPALQHAAEYAFFKCGEAGAAAGSWSRYVYDFVQRDAASLDQDDAVRQAYRLGNVMSDEHGGKAAAPPNVFDELLHFDARERVQRSQRFVQKQQIRIMDKSASQSHPLPLPPRQSRRPVVGSFCQTNLRQDFSRLRDERGLKAEHDVRKNSSPGQQARILEHDANIRLAVWNAATLPKVMVPLCGVSKPTTDRRRVLLPHPLRPTMATNSPAESQRRKFSSTVRPPKAMLTFLIPTETPREQRASSATISLELQVTGKVIPYRAV